MAKTETYNWRVDPELKQALEKLARTQNTSMSAVLERACWSLLGKGDGSQAMAGDADQARRRLVLDEIIVAARGADREGPSAPSATNANVRKAFTQKLVADRRRRGRPVS